MRLIDAEALTEQIQKLSNNEYMVNWLGVLIDTQPTVKVEPIEVPRPVRHGHWVGIDDEPCEVWECDVCGYIYEGDFAYNYCPHCGAKMDAEREEE